MKTDSVAPVGAQAAYGSPRGSEGFVLLLSMLLLMGIGAMGAGMAYNARHAQVAAQNHKNRIKAFYAADGIRALLAQETIEGNAGIYLDSAGVGVIEGEVWNGVWSGPAALKAVLGTAPSRKSGSRYLGSRWKDAGKYGVRWRGYLVPPTTGAYTFTVRTGGGGAFYLSSDEDPANLGKHPAAASAGGSDWPRPGTGTGQAIGLVMGKRYYFEFLHTQVDKGGVGQVGWKGPYDLVERPIPGKRLEQLGKRRENWDTVAAGRGYIRYSLMEAAPLVYSILTEAILGGPGDTTFRAPIHQTLNLRGDTKASPDSLWQRVIFYDFRADGSNPDFNRGRGFGGGGVTPGMVRRKGLRRTTENADYFGLDTIGKPVLASPRFNCGVEKWFTAWKPGWFKTYRYAGGGDDCGESPHAHDRAFENAVIKDSLLFVRRPDLGINAYQFKRFTPVGNVPAFTPLDGRGLGNEGPRGPDGRPHNYSFCMELHTLFEHTSGMVFEFNGDDDVWLFVNDSLVMDLGFVHTSAYASVSLDDLPLIFGDTYPLDFFYCERQWTGSSIDLITNLPVLMRTGRPTSGWKRSYGDAD